MRALKILFAVLLLSTPAFAQSKPVVIEDAWVRIYQANITVYFHILNNAEDPDRLLEVSTPLAEKAELMRTRKRGLKFTYAPLKDLEITGYDDERLKPGGLFVQLTGVKKELHVGDMVPLTLRFERSGHVEVNARVGNQLLGNR